MRGLDDRSRMNREIHVRICEGLRGKFPRPTRLADFMPDPYTSIRLSVILVMQMRHDKHDFFRSVLVEQAYQVLRFLCCTPFHQNYQEPSSAFILLLGRSASASIYIRFTPGRAVFILDSKLSIVSSMSSDVRSSAKFTSRLTKT